MRPTVYSIISMDDLRRSGAHPLIGQARDDLRPGLRAFPSGSYVILYFPADDGVEVVGAIHGARHLAGLFRRGER